MNWFASIGVGLCSAPLVGLITGTAAGVAADWLRVPQREGAAGYFVVAVALFGAIAGLVLGILFARGVFVSAPGFFKALGLTLGTALVVSLAALGLARVTADVAPEVGGRPVDLFIELRCPQDVTFEPVDDSTQAYARFIRLSDGETRGFALLDIKDSRMEDGRQIIPATLRIETSAAKKLLNIRLHDQHDLLFALDFGARPRERDFQWSRWIEAAYKVGTSRPSPEAAFAVRTQVRKFERPPPRPTREQEEASADARQEAELQALAPDAPLTEWLIFTRYGVPQHRIDRAAAAIRARSNFVAEMTYEMLHGEHESSLIALRAIEHIQPPPTELAEAVATVGREIAQATRDLDASPPAPEQQYSHGADISTRFSAWMVATRALQGKNGANFVPQLQEIIEPARKHTGSHIMRIDVVRVASFYLHQWAGIEPLPTDPPPR